MPRDLSVGDKAPDFVLPEAYGGSVDLASLLTHGAVMVVFFSGSFGYMCNLQMKQLMRMYEDIRRTDTEIVGIGTNSSFVNSAWKMHLKLPFPILSDFDGGVSGRYGVLIGKEGYYLAGHARRSVFIIDRHGTVRYAWISYDPSQAEEPDYDELLGACQKVHEISGTVPADRTPESSTP
jgi:peroxiredoxin